MVFMQYLLKCDNSPNLSLYNCTNKRQIVACLRDMGLKWLLAQWTSNRAV